MKKRRHLVSWAPQDWRDSRARTRAIMTGDDTLARLYFEMLNALMVSEDGTLPNDLDTLVDALGMTAEAISTRLPILLRLGQGDSRGGIIEHEGRLYNRRVLEDRGSDLAYRIDMKERGRAGGTKAAAAGLLERPRESGSFAPNHPPNHPPNQNPTPPKPHPTSTSRRPNQSREAAPAELGSAQPGPTSTQAVAQPEPNPPAGKGEGEGEGIFASASGSGSPPSVATVEETSPARVGGRARAKAEKGKERWRRKFSPEEIAALPGDANQHRHVFYNDLLDRGVRPADLPDPGTFGAWYRILGPEPAGWARLDNVLDDLEASGLILRPKAELTKYIFGAVYEWQRTEKPKLDKLAPVLQKLARVQAAKHDN